MNKQIHAPINKQADWPTNIHLFYQLVSHPANQIINKPVYQPANSHCQLLGHPAKKLHVYDQPLLTSQPNDEGLFKMAGLKQGWGTEW